MVRTNRYVLAQLAVALVAHVFNARERHLLLMFVHLANAVRRPFRARVKLTVVTLAEQRHELLIEAECLRWRQHEWEQLHLAFGPVEAGAEPEAVPTALQLVEASIGEVDSRRVAVGVADPLPDCEREAAKPVAVLMPAACQTTEAAPTPKPRRPRAGRKGSPAVPEREAKLAEATHLASKQGVSVREAARRCGVAESTLRKRLKAKPKPE